MNIIIIEAKNIEIEVMEQAKDKINSFGEILLGTASLPLVRHLLTVNEETEKLTEDMREIFNSFTEKLLYL